MSEVKKPKSERRPCPCPACNGILRCISTIRKHRASIPVVKLEINQSEELSVKKEILSNELPPPLSAPLSSRAVLSATKIKKTPLKRLPKAAPFSAASIKQISSTVGSCNPETSAPDPLRCVQRANIAPVHPTQQSLPKYDPQAASDVIRFPTYAELLGNLSILLREKNDLQAQLNDEKKETASVKEHFALLQTYCKQIEEQLRLEREATWNVDQRLDSLLKLTEPRYKRPLKRARVV